MTGLSKVPTTETVVIADRTYSGGMVARRILAAFLGCTVFAIAIYFAYQRSHADQTIVFVYAPIEIVGAAHVAQVDLVKRIVPRGSTVFYLMDTFEGWQSGLWQRSLYPDYDMQEVSGISGIQSPEMLKLRALKRIDYVLSAGTPPLNPGFVWQLTLPPYANGIPMLLGKLPPL